MKNFINSIEFPEPDNFNKLKEREEQTIQFQKEKELEKIKQEMEIEKEKEKVENIKKENEKFKSKLKEFFNFALKNPPESLLHELYVQGVDSKTTLKILNELEMNGKLKIEEKEENEEEELIKEYMNDQQKKKNEKQIEVSTAIPNLKNVKTSEETLMILEKFEKEKEMYRKRMNFELNETKLKMLLNLENQFKTQEQKLDWSKYLNDKYIKKYEKELTSQTVSPRDFDETIRKFNEIETFNEEESLTYQFENPIMHQQKGSVINMYLKSKL